MSLNVSPDSDLEKGNEQLRTLWGGRGRLGRGRGRRKPRVKRGSHFSDCYQRYNRSCSSLSVPAHSGVTTRGQLARLGPVQAASQMTLRSKADTALGLRKQSCSE